MITNLQTETGYIRIELVDGHVELTEMWVAKDNSAFHNYGGVRLPLKQVDNFCEILKAITKNE